VRFGMWCELHVYYLWLRTSFVATACYGRNAGLLVCGTVSVIGFKGLLILVRLYVSGKLLFRNFGGTGRVLI
jgi:hypothetical protein